MNTILIVLAVWSCLAMPSRAGGGYDDATWAVYRVELDLADRIQKQVLDHVLGPGQSAVFVTMDVEFSSQEKSSSRDGLGVVEKRKGVEVSTGSVVSDDLLPGQTQRASQSKVSRDSKLAVRRAAKRLAVRVLYNGKLESREVEAARESLKAVLEPQSKDADIKFVPAQFWQ